MTSGGSARVPIVGILAGRQPDERFSLHEGYVVGVVAAGGIPIILPVGPATDLEQLGAQVLDCDALLASGGSDVDPLLSRLANPSEAREVDRFRDDAEILAITTAAEAGKRVLGICRGIQILAVAFGGSLVGDVESAGFDKHDLEERQYEPVHDIIAQRGSLAEELLGPVREVNSIHHQAVAEVPEGFRASAWAPDDCIEAIEAPGMLGLQWHPERLVSIDERFLPPFRWLVSK